MHVSNRACGPFASACRIILVSRGIIFQSSLLLVCAAAKASCDEYDMGFARQKRKAKMKSVSTAIAPLIRFSRALLANAAFTSLHLIFARPSLPSLYLCAISHWSVPLPFSTHRSLATVPTCRLAPTHACSCFHLS